MKLISAQIAKFKNILDSTPVEIESDVTCLVGKNESGKTAYLHALYRLRPVRPNAVFNVRLQYPAWLEKRRRMMSDWASYCGRKPVSGDNVVNIRTRK